MRSKSSSQTETKQIDLKEGFIKNSVNTFWTATLDHSSYLSLGVYVNVDLFHWILRALSLCKENTFLPRAIFTVRFHLGGVKEPQKSNPAAEAPAVWMWWRCGAIGLLPLSLRLSCLLISIWYIFFYKILHEHMENLVFGGLESECARYGLGLQATAVEVLWMSGPPSNPVQSGK